MGLIVPTTLHPEREDQPLPYEWFVGIDWGSQQHQVSVLDRDRRRVGARVVDHDGASLARLADWLWTLSAGQPQRVAVAIDGVGRARHLWPALNVVGNDGTDGLGLAVGAFEDDDGAVAPSRLEHRRQPARPVGRYPAVGGAHDRAVGREVHEGAHHCSVRCGGTKNPYAVVDVVKSADRRIVELRVNQLRGAHGAHRQGDRAEGGRGSSYQLGPAKGRRKRLSRRAIG